MAERTDEHGDTTLEGRDEHFMDIDRMINEGLGGGVVSYENGWINSSTTDTMTFPESVAAEEDPERDGE
ncbi:hypothetical protein MJA45_22975 [Paenibacillus aurantius]|uniref:DUF4025 domain-containing protein n=1 Tax=Paenibacillus aurantius TaxID=2918900 RepID=A0AA96REF6_9BACL|nr:hypothetical protein [Paenibacillus aurantius]WJH35184.1 hypothetical protein N6H14_03605 [Paenibacillus sp. CC-CFT747]WNQ10451.1 hypothetical protein MJA45_22975 [Paenibacillus aurantius]